MPPRPGYVYRLYDAADRLLYIGRSSHPDTRIATHRRTSAGWQTAIVRWDIERFASISAALRGQRRATEIEQPLHPDLTCDLVTRPVMVYRIFDTAGVLQYIGQTHDLTQRLQTHRDRRVFPVASWTTVMFPNRETAVEAERAAIEAECPLHNKVRGGGSESAPVDRHARRWTLFDQVQTQVRSGEMSHRAAIEEMVLAGWDLWKAADKLGLKTGWPNARRKYKTLDSLMVLNGLE